MVSKNLVCVCVCVSVYVCVYIDQCTEQLCKASVASQLMIGQNLVNYYDPRACLWRRKSNIKAIFEDRIALNFPELKKDSMPQIKSILCAKNRINSNP